MTLHNDLITIPTIEDLTRRTFISGALASALLIACSDDNEDSDSFGTNPGTITVVNKFGTFEVSLAPQRVVGLEGRRDLETALALGLRPIVVGANAVPDGRLASFLPTSFSMEGVSVFNQAEPDVELLFTLQPDLILSRDSNIERLLEPLRQLAPLVPVAPTGPWRPDLEAVATTLGREGQLAETLREHDSLRDEIRSRHRERIASATVAIVQYTDSTFYSSSTSGFYLQINTLSDLGGKHLPFLENDNLTNDGFSVENMRELVPADVIVLIADSAAVSELESSPLWRSLPAVSAGRVVTTDFRTNYGSVYAATECLRFLDRAYSTLD